jgi:hypothetical protein
LDNVDSVPSTINLFVGSGDVPTRRGQLPLATLPVGWGHHKIIIIDGTQAIIGGMNFGQESLNASTNAKDAVNDISALVKGGLLEVFRNSSIICVMIYLLLMF